MTGNHWSDWLPEGQRPPYPCLSDDAYQGAEDGFTEADAPDRDELMRLIAEKLDRTAIEGSVA